ncbi:MAG: fumarylacetoacetase [Pseudomonadota bacterium]|nr:fumarylacetoacetase [Pseudomonadota bacterium]
MNLTDETHDPALASWVASADGHADFPIQNLPLGVFSTGGGEPRIGAAIGDMIVDVGGLGEAGLLEERWRAALTQRTLNAWFAQGRDEGRALRRSLSALLSDEAQRRAVEPHLVSQDEATMDLPCAIGDYTDFYVGIHHAMNVGKQFRPDQPLLPNYKYVPIGYHGRASSVRVTGEDVIRPKGQRKPPEAEAPEYGPSRRLDYELELGMFIGRGNALGEPIAIGSAPDHVAGYCLLNDWSARDLQAWEYQPLGPFLAKNFLTSISPWVVSPEALAPFRTAIPDRPAGDPGPLPYLSDDNDRASGGLGVTLTASLLTAKMRISGDQPFELSHGEAAAAMYWSAAQIITHHSSNGCNLMPGDLIGTGTLSVADASGLGSMMEISQSGKTPLTLPNGEQRSFLEDGDELTLSARCSAPGAVPIGFGTCRGRVCPPR